MKRSSGILRRKKSIITFLQSNVCGHEYMINRFIQSGQKVDILVFMAIPIAMVMFTGVGSFLGFISQETTLLAIRTRTGIAITSHV